MQPSAKSGRLCLTCHRNTFMEGRCAMPLHQQTLPRRRCERGLLVHRLDVLLRSCIYVFWLRLRLINCAVTSPSPSDGMDRS